MLDRKLKKDRWSIASISISIVILAFELGKLALLAGFCFFLYRNGQWILLGGMFPFFCLNRIINYPLIKSSHQQLALIVMCAVGIVMFLSGIDLGRVIIFWIIGTCFDSLISFRSAVTFWSFFQQQKINKNHEEFLVDLSQVTQWLQQWQSVHGNINRLLTPPQATLAATPDPSVTAYSFDRLVVCNRPSIAQILLENQFHFEHNCAILSITGYPENVCDTVLEMVRRNPDLIVYAFHDASPDGVNLIHRLRSESRWFPDTTVKIIDVGLLPRQVIAARRKMFVRQSATSATAAHELSPATRQSLTPSELVWLDAGNYAELESFTPQQLIQTLQRSIAISRSSDFESDGNITLWSDDGVSLIDGFDGGGFG
jgi:hypothetical protein